MYDVRVRGGSKNCISEGERPLRVGNNDKGAGSYYYHPLPHHTFELLSSFLDSGCKHPCDTVSRTLEGRVTIKIS
jgi:hypothetical protein